MLSGAECRQAAMLCDAMSRKGRGFGETTRFSVAEPYPECVNLIFRSTVENGFRSIFGPGPALKRSRDTSGNGGGLPEGGKRARSSGLERISWILSAGCSGLACQGPTEWAGWLAGWAGLAGWLGWLGWLAGVTGRAKQRAGIFRALRPRPAGCGPQPKTDRPL